MIEEKGVKARLYSAMVILLTLLLALICLLPLIHIVSLAFSSKEAAIKGEVGFWPVGFNIDSFRYILIDTNNQFLNSFLVSIKRVVVGVSINMTIILLGAYSLSMDENDFPSRDRYMRYIMFTWMFYGGLVPWYLMVRYTGLMGSFWSLVIPQAVPIYNMILMMNFFRNLPQSVKEAAEIDGASHFQSLWHVYIPMSTPSIATITLFCIVTHWNSFIDGRMFINHPSQMPLQTYIQSLTINIDELSRLGASGEDLASQYSTKTFNAAKIVAAMTPILVIYPSVQKYFVKGINLGAVKE